MQMKADIFNCCREKKKDKVLCSNYYVITLEMTWLEDTGTAETYSGSQYINITWGSSIIMVCLWLCLRKS